MARARLGAAQGLALAHLLREVILAVESPTGLRLDYASRLTPLARAWPRADDGSLVALPPTDALDELRQLVTDHLKSLDREPDFGRMLTQLDPGAIAVTPPGVLRQWTRLRQRTVAMVHAPRARDKALPSPERAADLYDELTDTLFALLSPFFDTIAELDALLAQVAPTDDDARRVAALLKLRQQHLYFFERAGPAWVEPLARTGAFFRDAPAPFHTDQGMLIPDWPDSRYLARVAPAQPRAVAELVRHLSVHDNAYVVRDATQALRRVGADLSATMSQRIQGWARIQPADVYAEELAGLAADWAEAGQISLGIAALRTAIRNVETGSAGSEYVLSEVLGDPVDRLRRCALGPLTDALLAQLRRIVPRDRTWQSTSRLWRPRIERASRYDQHEAKNFIVDALRACLRDLPADELVPRLRDMLRRKPSIFQRLVLDVAGLRTTDVADLVVELISTPERWDSYETSEEFRTLLGAAAGANLTTDVNELLLSWLRSAAPARRAARTDEELVALWRWQLGVVAHMPDQIRTAWTSALGLPVEPDGDREPDNEQSGLAPEDDDEEDGAAWVGPTSPIDAAVIAAMEPGEIAHFLKTWQSIGEFMTPTSEGLGRQLAGDVAARAPSYVDRLADFVGVSPTYSRHVLSGLRDAAKQGIELDWELVFPFLEWVVGQGFDLAGDSAWRDADPDWSGAQQAVASLLEQAVPDSDAASWDERTAAHAAAVLAPLLRHPDPDERGALADQMDPYTMSINSVRGEAVHAASQLLLHTSRAGLSTVQRELGELLLQIAASDGTPPIRAAFGRFLPWLLPFGGRPRAEWVTALLSPSLRDPGPRAAFDAYLVFGHAFSENFPALEDSYRQRIDLAAEAADDKRWQFLREPSERLGEHLLTYYLRGLLTLEPGEAIDRFFSGANARSRAGALRWIVDAFREPDFNLDLASRALDLLEWRINAGVGAVSLEEYQSLASIPAPASGVAARALSHIVLPALRELKGSTSRAELSLVAAQVSQQPLEALEALRWLILGDRWRGLPSVQRDAVRQILVAGLGASDEAAGLATKLIHLLGARGYAEFGDLL